LTAATKIKLGREIPITLNSSTAFTVEFLNSIREGSIKTSQFVFRERQCYAYDRGGVIKISGTHPITGNWTEFANEDFGNVDYNTGLLSFKNIIMTGNDKTIYIWASPIDSDFFTLRQNILRIDKVNANIIQKSGNIEHKK
jgi:hypothetical protein